MARGRDKSSAAPVGRASASPSPMRRAGTAKQAAELGRAEDVRGLFDDIAAARPSAVAEAGLGALQRSIPGCARAEEAAARAVEGARYGAALARLAACDRAARTPRGYVEDECRMAVTLIGLLLAWSCCLA